MPTREGIQGQRCQQMDMIPAEHGFRSSRHPDQVIVSM
jgi:hypothetical protein